jgi:hypothetical protein
MIFYLDLQQVFPEMQAKSFLLHLFLIVFFVPSKTFSQDNILELFPETEPVTHIDMDDDSSGLSVFMDAGSLFIPVKDIFINGLSVKLGETGTHFASAFAFDLINSRRIFATPEFNVALPQYTYVFFGLDNEYIFNPEKRISISLHLKTGFGYADYSDLATAGGSYYYEMDDSSSYYTPVAYYNSGRIASDNFFSIEPGINVLCNLTNWLSMGAGWNSRIVLGANKKSPLRDDAFYSGNIFLRFRVPGKNKDSVE